MTPGRGRSGGERALVAALAAAAALRLLLFSAAFPFFTNVDEHKHVDLVLKYARGYWPRPGQDAFEAETGRLLGRFGSPEYNLAPGTPAPPPPWQRSAAGLVHKLERDAAFLASRPNKEAAQPPVYYLTAAAWWRLGGLLGLDDARRLYFVRALGALGLAALVWLSHRWLADAYPGNAGVRLGVPALLAVFPQDALWYVTRDALSPLLGGVAFLCLAGIARTPGRGGAHYAAAGAATALACLAKYTHAALLAVAGLATLRAGAARRASVAWRLVGLWTLALAPLAWWLVRNQLLFGDPTATALKAERLGWEAKSPSEWLSHPLFGPSGLAAFVTGLIPKFWRGELVWHRQLLAWPAADALYTATSVLFLGLAAVALARRRAGDAVTEGAALLFVGVAVAELMVLSLLYRFPEAGNPSAARPWFDHGRLIAGALLPFALLYVRGLQTAVSSLPACAQKPAFWAGLGLVGGVALASEIALTAPVFASAYNAYHLP